MAVSLRGWGEIGGICFDQEAISRDFRGHLTQVDPAAFHGDDSGYANVKSQVEVVAEFFAGAAEAMDHTINSLAAIDFQHLEKSPVAVAFMEDHRQILLAGDFKLPAEPFSVTRY